MCPSGRYEVMRGALRWRGAFRRDLNESESRNIVARFTEIEDMCPAEIDENALPYFADWLIDERAPR